MSHPRPLPTIAICGAGQMGAAMAVSFCRAGYRTLIWVRNAQKIEGIRQTLSGLNAQLTEHTGDPGSPEGSTDVLTDLNELDAVADVVVDCIAESMSEKAWLFRQFTQAKQRGALFLTTTSGLSITELGRESGIGTHLVGTHFWNPPHLMPLVEVIRGEDTQPAMADRAAALVESIGKIPVRVARDVPGFIGNRLLHAMWREAIWLIEHGVASAEDIDRVAKLTFGLRMPALGPLENMDLVGLDLVHAIHKYLLRELSGEVEPPKALQEKLRQGALGMKTGRGFHDWKRRDSKEVIERRDRQILQQLNFLREQQWL